MGALQQGHLGRVLARATMRPRRMVAIEFGMCRSGRIGGAPGSVTVGNGRSREWRGETWSRGGGGASFGDQEAIGGDAQCGVMVEAAPPAPFIIAEAEFLLELLIIALDPPSQLCQIAQTIEGGLFGQGGKPILGRLVFVSRPLAKNPFFSTQPAQQVIAVLLPHSAPGNGRAEPIRGSLAPC